MRWISACAMTFLLVMSAHGFVMYEIAGRYAGCQVIKVPERNLTADVDAMLAAVGPRMLANAVPAVPIFPEAVI